MAQTTVSTKGQIVLPKAIRDKRRWKAGMRLTVEERSDGVLLKPVDKKKKLGRSTTSPESLSTTVRLGRSKR